MVEGNVPAKEVRRFVAKSLQSFPVRVVTLFSTMYGVCLSGDTVFKVGLITLLVHLFVNKCIYRPGQTGLLETS